MDEYIILAKEKYGYNGEQALGMLFWHKHNLERAVLDLANFTPFPDEWTVEDKVLFEQAFQFHGKSFHRIRQMVSLFMTKIRLCRHFIDQLLPNIDFVHVCLCYLNNKNQPDSFGAIYTKFLRKIVFL